MAKFSGKTKDGTKIMRQPVTRKGNITMAQARRAVRLYFEKQFGKPSAP